jgi:hypothetical protein
MGVLSTSSLKVRPVDNSLLKVMKITFSETSTRVWHIVNKIAVRSQGIWIRIYRVFYRQRQEANFWGVGQFTHTSRDLTFVALLGIRVSIHEWMNTFLLLSVSKDHVWSTQWNNNCSCRYTYYVFIYSSIRIFNRIPQWPKNYGMSIDFICEIP